MHEKIMYSYLSKTQSISVRPASDVIKSYIKILAKKKVIMSYLSIYWNIKTWKKFY